MTFTLAAGNELAHALTAHVASRSGIRVMSIKGFVADRYGLREPHLSADADVIVDPSRFDEFCNLMRERGWYVRHGRIVPSLLGHHSETFIHDDWPNDVDVHSFFPGFLGSPDSAFDALWNTRESMTVAQVDVTVPSRAGAAVIMALHALRYTHSDRHASELSHLEQLLNTDFTEAERQEVVAIARAGGALWVMREVFEAMEIPVEIDATPGQQAIWNTNRATIEDGSAVGWLTALRTSPWRSKPRLLLDAVWISRRDIPRNDPDRLPTAAEAWRHRRLRWRRGAQALAHYLRWRSRRE